MMPKRVVISALFIIIFASLSLFGFLGRFVPYTNNLVDILMTGVSLFALLALLKKVRNIKSDQGLITIIIVLFTLSLAISFLMNFRINSIIQYTLYMAYLTPLFFLHDIHTEDAYKIFLPLLLLIGFMQLPFDLLFPRVGLDIHDMYSGTLSEANFKSRYLFFLVMVAVFLYRSRSRFVNLAILPLAVITMLFSFKLGDSIFAYLFGVSALALGLLHRKKWLLLVLSLSLILFVVYIIHRYENEPLIYMNFNRFFDPEHGVYGIVLFAFKQLKESFFLGTGLGEFASRTSQSVGGIYLNSIPRTMITYGIIYQKTVAPSGLPSYILIVAESGIVGILISGLLIYFLYKNAHPSYLGFTFFIYIFLLSMFSPAFYEGPDGAIFLYTYLVINKAMYYASSKRHKDMGKGVEPA